VATKKQVRRRQKERRHEYEYVYVDEQGQEVEVDEEPEPERPRAAKRTAGKSAKRTRASSRSGRVVQPASWRRVAKRGLIFAPLMFLTVTLLAPDSATPVANVVQTIFLLMIFLPFSYAMDSMTYRMWRKRTGQTGDAKGG
jgi:Flp pilus assembly protein TadB